MQLFAPTTPVLRECLGTDGSRALTSVGPPPAAQVRGGCNSQFLIVHIPSRAPPSPSRTEAREGRNCECLVCGCGGSVLTATAIKNVRKRRKGQRVAQGALENPGPQQQLRTTTSTTTTTSWTSTYNLSPHINNAQRTTHKAQRTMHNAQRTMHNAQRMTQSTTQSTLVHSLHHPPPHTRARHRRRSHGGGRDG